MSLKRPGSSRHRTRPVTGEAQTLGETAGPDVGRTDNVWIWGWCQEHVSQCARLYRYF